ncbi:MAG: LysE family translocator [Gammaproteobacteria bacterium]|nr:LysE family translocator [Gammaproteobacteria bacterium]
MPLEQLIALMGFVVVMTGTPGPNNMMLLASGANFGFRRSIPHILGITAGCQILLLAIALGLGQLLTRFPVLELVLKVLCGIALLYLTWMLVKPAFSAMPVVVPHDPDHEPVVTRPLSFWQGALFQWVNPKAWMMMLTAIATYTQPQTIWSNTLMIGLLFVVLGMPVISMWNLFGASLRTFLLDPLKARVFNLVMGVLLLGSMYPLFQ